MRLNKRSLWSLLVLVSAFCIAVPDDAFAQKRGGGSRRSSSSRRSSPSKRAAPKTKKASPKRGAKTGKSSKKKGEFGSSKRKAGASKPKATKADQKAFDKAKANGTAFKDRKSASADFKKKNAAKYGSTYKAKPATRPGHIPQTTMVNGSSTTIIYNQGGGGYGYMNALGTFMLYDAMSDMAMRPYYNRQMASAGYAYGPRPVVGFGFGTIIVIGGIFGVVAIVAIKQFGGRKSHATG